MAGSIRNQLGLEFDLVSDTNRTIVDAYDVATDFGHLGVETAAKRAVFVVDGSRTVTYAWVSDALDVEPDYDEIEDAMGPFDRSIRTSTRRGCTPRTLMRSATSEAKR